MTCWRKAQIGINGRRVPGIKLLKKVLQQRRSARGEQLSSQARACSGGGGGVGGGGGGGVGGGVIRNWNSPVKGKVPFRVAKLCWEREGFTRENLRRKGLRSRRKQKQLQKQPKGFARLTQGWKKKDGVSVF